MKLNNLFETFKNSLKGSKINAQATNMGEEIANAISTPMEALMTGIEKEINDEITGIEKKVTDAVTKTFEDRIKALEEANAKLGTENEELKKEVADKLGGETTTGANPKNEQKKFGSGIVSQ